MLALSETKLKGRKTEFDLTSGRKSGVKWILPESSGVAIE